MMTGKRPLQDISYADIVAARAGSRSSTVDIPCSVCGPQHQGASARRKVMRTWTLGGDRISVHCARCGVEGYVAPDTVNIVPRRTAPVVDDDEVERQRRIARLA